MVDPLRLLVIGGGSIGERHVRCFQAAGDVQIELCEIDDQVREVVGRRYAVQRTYGDLASASIDPPDAAVICTPAHLHVEMALKLLSLGIPVLIEKPLGTSTHGVAELVSLASQEGRVAAVAYVLRAHPAVAGMRAAVDTGRFGTPLQVVATFGQHFPYYRPAYRNTYYRDGKTGGGAIQDALTHVVNAVEWMVGPVTELTADAEHLSLPGVSVEDTVHVLARHGKLLACYSLNQHQPANEGSITVVGTKGMARFEAQHHRWSWTTGPEQPWQIEPHQVLQRDAPFTLQAHAFIDALAGRRTPLCSLSAGVQTLKVNLAVLRSVESRGWVSVDTTDVEIAQEAARP